MNKSRFPQTKCMIYMLLLYICWQALIELKMFHQDLHLKVRMTHYIIYLMQKYISTKNQSKIALFVAKIIESLQDEAFSDTILWNPKNGGFGIANLEKFREQLLPKYFKHSNIRSFERQLNMYNFEKGWNKKFSLYYKHKYFIEGEPTLLKKIKRKKSPKKQKKQKEEMQNQSFDTQIDYLLEMKAMTQKYKALKKRCIKSIKKTTQAIQQSNQTMIQIIAGAYNTQFLNKVSNILQFSFLSNIQKSEEDSRENQRLQPKRQLNSQSYYDDYEFWKQSQSLIDKICFPKAAQQKQQMLF